jgi:hypothetical protein
MELKILLATELDGQPWKGNVITLDLHPDGLASAEQMVSKLANYAIANIHQVEGVRSHAVSSEMRHDPPEEITCCIEATINLVMNGEEKNEKD